MRKDEKAGDPHRGTADFFEDGDLVRRGVTIRRPLNEVRSAWDGSIEGDVTFSEAPGDRGTEVRVVAPKQAQSTLAEVAGAFTGDLPEDTLMTRLRDFKALLETGEVATVIGQPSGREAIA